MQNLPWWWSYEPFCLPVSTIAGVHDPTVISSVALRMAREDSVHIVVIAVVHGCLRAETHPRGNVVSAVITVCLRFGHHGLIN